MTRLSIEDLPKPPKDFRPSKASPRFETKERAAEEDRFRRRRIDALSSNPERLKGPLTLDALEQLELSIAGASTPASSVYMRKHRNRIGGSLSAFIADSFDDVRTFTIVPHSWECPGDALHQADPRSLLNGFRSAVIREGFSNRKGWLLASVHGEHEPTEDIFRPHIHGAVKGEAILCLDRLRHRQEYRSSRRELKGPVFQRVRITRKSLTDLPEPLTYIVQSFWPKRAAFINADGEDKRQREKRRIEEPRHTEVLMWLDRWRLRDTCLLMGLQVTRNGFRTTRHSYTNGDDR